jgi:hypothetical protein
LRENLIGPLQRRTLPQELLAQTLVALLRCEIGRPRTCAPSGKVTGPVGLNTLSS